MSSKQKTKFTPEPSKKGSPSMEELLKMYGGASFGHTVGEKVKGRVVSIDSARVIIDIGGKSEGLVAEKAYKEAEGYIKTLSIGDVVDASVIVPETSDGYTILSFRQAAGDAIWKQIENASETSKPILVEGKGVMQSGITADVFGITGFIPTSQLGRDAAQNPQALIGKKFEAVVIDYDRDVKKVVLSEKRVSEKEEIDRAIEALKNIQEGDTFEGEVTTIYDFGCFVKIDVPVASKKEKSKGNVPLEGLVHVSELSWEKVGSPHDVVTEGQKVQVKVVGKKNDKLALSMKQTGKDPWDEVLERYSKDKKVKGTVTRLTDFGAFVQLEPGLEGLIHITKIPPEKKLSKGAEVEVYVEDVDKVAKRISLGLVLTQKPVGYK